MEAVQKRRRDKDGLHTGLSGSTREHDWVVGSQILTREQNQMKKDLAEVKAYAEAMADSNHARDAYVDKEQDKFFPLGAEGVLPRG